MLFKRLKKRIKGKNNQVSIKKTNLNIQGNGNKILAKPRFNVAKKTYAYIKAFGDNNLVEFYEDFNSQRSLNIEITGNNNQILIKSNFNLKGSLNIQIVGENNKIIIGKNIAVHDNLNVQILEKCINGSIIIGDETTFWNTKIQTCDMNSSIEIGKDCMFSFNTSVLNCDGHAIFQDGKLINQGKILKVGNHCWVGFNSTIYKNVHLPDNIIIARDTLVTSTVNKLNIIPLTVLGGGARIIRTGVTWSRKTPNEILKGE